MNPVKSRLRRPRDRLRNVFSEFGILNHAFFEDANIVTRAKMLGGVAIIKEFLVKYRVHSGGFSRSKDLRESFRKTHLFREKFFLQILNDLKSKIFTDKMPPEKINKIKDIADYNYNLSLMRLSICSDKYFKRVMAWLQLIPREKAKQLIIMFITFLTPNFVCKFLLLIIRNVKRLFRRIPPHESD